MHVGSRSFLLPVDDKSESAAALEASSVSLDELYTRISEVAPRRIILLDACRNDPFKDVIADPSSPIELGLGAVGYAVGTVFGFATEPGKMASDGDGPNSPFAAALLKYLGKPGELSSNLKLVQMEAYDRSYGRQYPHVVSGLPDLVFTASRGEPLQE